LPQIWAAQSLVKKDQAPDGLVRLDAQDAKVFMQELRKGHTKERHFQAFEAILKVEDVA
jgi:hypothetical protein